MVVDEDIGFEIILKTAEVNIGRTASGYAIVGNQYLAVQESTIIKIYFYSRAEHLIEICASSPLHKPRISVAWHHYSHINTSHGSSLEGKEHGFMGQEIGCSYLHISCGGMDDTHQALHDFGVRSDGTAGNHLRQA